MFIKREKKSIYENLITVFAFNRYKKKYIELFIVLGLGFFIGKMGLIGDTLYYIKTFSLQLYSYTNPFILKPKKIIIDIKHDDYQLLAYNRHVALQKGVLLKDNRDFVPAKITYDGYEYKSKIRLKGDRPDHWNDERKWSFRLKVKNNQTVLGMREFSINKPKTRGFLNEYIFHKFLKFENLLSIRYDFIDVVLNGNSLGIYAIEESFDKILVENNGYREGVVFKFNEDQIWEARFRRTKVVDELYLSSPLQIFQKLNPEKDSIKFEQFLISKNLINSFRNNQLKTSQVFNVPKLAKLFAITELFGHQHATLLNNIRFYYNPILSKIEPIGFDNQIIKPVRIDKLYINKKLSRFWSDIFSDENFYKEYIKALNEISKKNKLDDFFNHIEDDLKVRKEYIFKDYPHYKFLNKEILYNNQEYIREILNPKHILKAYIVQLDSNKVQLSINNSQSLPLIINNISFGSKQFIPINNNKIKGRIAGSDYEFTDMHFSLKPDSSMIVKLDRKSILKLNYTLLGNKKIHSTEIYHFPFIDYKIIKNSFFRYRSNIKNIEFFEVNEAKKTINILPGAWVLKDQILIPESYKLVCGSNTSINFLKSAFIATSGSVILKGGDFKKNEHVYFYSSDSTGRGLFVFEANSDSYLSNVEFDNLGSPSRGKWNLLGAINFYESDVVLENCVFKNNRSEDALNVIRSDFEIRNCIFKNTLRDAFDSDFSSGQIVQSNFINCGNDCIDLSGSSVQVNDIFIYNAGDKGISAGESSKISLFNIEISNSKVGIASKDNSIVVGNELLMKSCKIGVTCYQKKPEFGPGNINLDEVVFLEIDSPLLIEAGSSVSINEEISIQYSQNVEDKILSIK